MEPSTDELPLGHDAHTLSPGVDEYEFAEQLRQVAEPATLVYLPSGHCRQANATAPASLEYVPVGHWLHVNEPLTVEYEPAAQS